MNKTRGEPCSFGVAGERLVNHYTFYAAFTSPEQFRLMHGERTLGSISLAHGLQEGMFLIFAGRRWRIGTIDVDQKTIYVTPARGGMPSSYGGDGIMVHDLVRETMRALYADVMEPRYLNETARRLFSEGRDQFARLQRQLDQAKVILEIQKKASEILGIPLKPHTFEEDE